MIPILYDAKATDFSNNGIGPLPEAFKGHVIKDGGVPSVEFKYPVSGKNFEHIKEECIVVVKPDERQEPQPFRITSSSKPIDGNVTFKGRHIAYDLADNVIEQVSCEGVTAAAAMNSILGAAVLKHPFECYSDLANIHDINLENISPLQAFKGIEGSVVDTFGGELDFDVFRINLLKRIGRDTSVRIAYGKNLTSANQETNLANTYTGVYPYAIYKAEDDSMIKVVLAEKVIYSPHAKSFPRQKICVQDFSDKFKDGEEINEETLRQKVNEWIKSSGFDVPKVNITASFVHLWQDPEYAEKASRERLVWGDTAIVDFSLYGIETKARIIRTDYDFINEKYIELTLGESKADLASIVGKTSSSIETIKKDTDQKFSQIVLENQLALKRASAAITGNSGGFVRLFPEEHPQELLVLDNYDIKKALNVWRFNKAGLGHSSTGYDGLYTLAILADGSINATMIRVGILNAALIRAGIAASANGEFSFNFDEGIIRAAKAYLTGEFTVLGDKADLKVINTAGTERDREGLIGMVRYNKAGKPDAYITFTDEEILDTTKYGIKIESIDSSVLISSRREGQGVRNEINWNGRFTVGVPDGEFARQFLELDNTGMRLDKGIDTNYLMRDKFASITHTRAIDKGQGKYLTWRTVHGAGVVITAERDIPSSAVEVKGVTSSSYYVRSDMYSTTEGDVCFLLRSGDLPGTVIKVSGGKLFVGEHEVVTK